MDARQAGKKFQDGRLSIEQLLDLLIHHVIAVTGSVQSATAGLASHFQRDVYLTNAIHFDRLMSHQVTRFAERVRKGPILE